MLKIIRDLLLKIVDSIDAGNSNNVYLSNGLMKMMQIVR